jgi:endonuclease/exonuclease/phosphatase family metal-dependent hydrolase
MDADIVCLQEVVKFSAKHSKRFALWPQAEQAHVLAPDGYHAVYETNARKKHSEHGNALLSRWPVSNHQHRDISAHRFEQRGLLHAEIQIERQTVHVVVLHLALNASGRVQQVRWLKDYLDAETPADAPLIVAGDFNDWAERLHDPLRRMGLATFEGIRLPTFPARWPVLHLDRIYMRGLKPVHASVPRGPAWSRMSDHLPLVAHLEWA